MRIYNIIIISHFAVKECHKMKRRIFILVKRKLEKLWLQDWVDLRCKYFHAIHHFSHVELEVLDGAYAARRASLDPVELLSFFWAVQ